MNVEFFLNTTSLNTHFFLANDEFRESDHPRQDNGQFGSGGSPKMRDYEPKELDWEHDVEYRKYSRPLFPHAFKDRADFQKQYDAAPLRPLTEQEFRKLGNSMASSGIGKNEDWVHKTFSHRRDSKRIIEALKHGETAPPIVLQHGKHLHLMAGQTRLAAGAALNMKVPVKIINVGPKPLAGDEADWQESKHPRDSDGKFATSGSSGSSKPVQVSSTLTGVFSAGGFKKKYVNGKTLYLHPSGVAVEVHPAPEGKKWSSSWTSSKGGKEDVKGEGGSSLAKLLRVAVQKAEQKKAAVSAIKQEFSAVKSSPDVDLTKLSNWDEASGVLKEEGYTPAGVSDDGDFAFFDHENDDGGKEILAFNRKTLKGYFVDEYQAPHVQSSVKHTEFAAAEEALKGYSIVEMKPNKVIYKSNTSEAKVQYAPETGEWIAQTPGHMTKEGTGGNALKELLVNKKIAPGVKNSGQVIQTEAETAKQTEAQKKQAEAAKKAQEEHEKKNAVYNKLAKQATHPTSEQQNAIAKYSGSGYQHWNQQLRHNPDFAKTDKATKHLDEWLHANVFEEDVVLYRKVSNEYAKILKSVLMEGSKFIDRGFISTSPNEGVWHGDFKFVIHAPKGSKGAALGKWSHHTNEKEVLLPRNSAFVVTAYDHGKGEVHVTLDQSHFEVKA